MWCKEIRLLRFFILKSILQNLPELSYYINCMIITVTVISGWKQHTKVWRTDVLLLTPSCSLWRRLAGRCVPVNLQGWGILKLLNNSPVLNFDRSQRYTSAAVTYGCICARVIDSNRARQGCALLWSHKTNTLSAAWWSRAAFPSPSGCVCCPVTGFT